MHQEEAVGAFDLAQTVKERFMEAMTLRACNHLKKELSVCGALEY